MKNKIFTLFFFVLMLVLGPLPLSGQHDNNVQTPEGNTEAEEEFNAREFILDHIADSHEWHILTKKNGESVAIYLPVIIYSKETGLHIFSSRRLAHGNEYKGFKLEEEGELKGKIISLNENGTINEDSLPLDFSITKTIVGMLAAALIGLWVFLSL